MFLESPVGERREQAHAGEPDRGLECPGGHVAARLAVGQRQRRETLRLVRGDDLRDGAAGVVCHEVDAGQVERSTEVLDALASPVNE